MRAIALAGLVAGVAAVAAPLPTAAAQCDYEIVLFDGQPSSGGCRNSCVETGDRYEAARAAAENRLGGAVGLPSYWSLFACTM